MYAELRLARAGDGMTRQALAAGSAILGLADFIVAANDREQIDVRRAGWRPEVKRPRRRFAASSAVRGRLGHSTAIVRQTLASGGEENSGLGHWAFLRSCLRAHGSTREGDNG